MKELKDFEKRIMVDVISVGGCMAETAILQGFSCTAESKVEMRVVGYYEKKIHPATVLIVRQVLNKKRLRNNSNMTMH